jgi:acetolactate decarboxylase
MATLFQRSTIGALLAGIFDGEETVTELLRHGNFGLGTFNALDGEMVVLDGVCYQLKSDGTATVVGGHKLTPFAAVTDFAPEHSLDASDLDHLAVNTLIDHAARSKNLTLAVRITGSFSHVLTRTVSAQQKPYPTLEEASRGETEVTFAQTTGVILGYRTPEFEHSIGVAGYHLHYLDEARASGGHILDFHLDHGTIELMEITEIHLSLPRHGAFLRANLDDAGADAAIQRVEGTSPE